MPRAPKYRAVARQWQILSHLPPGAPGRTSAEVMERLKRDEFSVSQRTVERDLVALEGPLGLHCDDAQLPWRWHWPKKARTLFGEFDLVEATALSMAESALKPLLPASLLPSVEEKFVTARKRLSLASEHPLAKWAASIRSVPSALPSVPPFVPPAVFALIRDALVRERCVRVAYLRPEDRRARSLLLHPLGLFHRGSTFYLIATAYNYPDLRHFALHRIRSVEVLDQKRRMPRDFDLDRYLAAGAAHFGGGREINLKLRVDEGLASLLEESRFNHSQRLKTVRGCYYITVKIAETWQLRWWILSQGSALEVLAPKALRREIADTLREAAALYRG